MCVLESLDLETLTRFQSLKCQLALVKREPINGSKTFFSKLMKTTFTVVGQVYKESNVEDINFILEEDIPSKLQNDPFYSLWVNDMAYVCNVFCDIVGEDAIDFCLGTHRGCPRYHIDNVPIRLLVTYAGRGTEWLPDAAADRQAFEDGMPNKLILKDPSALRFVDGWDVAIFRGGSKGLLHRTPDAALNGTSILMRLDRKDFWNNILGQSQGNVAPKLAVK